MQSMLLPLHAPVPPGWGGPERGVWAELTEAYIKQMGLRQKVKRAPEEKDMHNIRVIEQGSSTYHRELCSPHPQRCYYSVDWAVIRRRSINTQWSPKKEDYLSRHDGRMLSISTLKWVKFGHPYTEECHCTTHKAAGSNEGLGKRYSMMRECNNANRHQRPNWRYRITL